MNLILARKLLTDSPEKAGSNSVFRLHNIYKETMKQVRSYTLENVVKNYHIFLPQKLTCKLTNAPLVKLFKELDEHEMNETIPWRKQRTIVVKKYFVRLEIESLNVTLWLKLYLELLSRIFVLRAKVNDRLDSYSNFSWSCYE